MPAAKTARRELSSSLEDYLEAVRDLVRVGRVARVRDIAARLRVGMPSVSVALKALGEKGLVNYDPYQVVTLTHRGEKVGGDIARRHAAIRAFLTGVLGVEPSLAESNACRIEHAIDDEVLQRLTDFAGAVLACPHAERPGSGGAPCRPGRPSSAAAPAGAAAPPASADRRARR